MELSQVHFAHPLWLWLGVVIPLIWVLFYLFFHFKSPRQQLEKFIDKHLLQFLLVKKPSAATSFWKPLLLWSLAWTCLLLALAGPRWNFREIETFSRDQSLIVLLDLSESMNAVDVKPSRLGRAKQVIEDLINSAEGVKFGLIAFAADPHMLIPLTEDKETVRHLLPSIETNLVFIQGSRLSSALEMASRMFENEIGYNKSIVVISDGDFEDGSAFMTAKKISNKGIVIYTIGVGKAEGAHLQDSKGNLLKKNEQLVFSKLDTEKLKEISKMGNGSFFEANYSDAAAESILKELASRADAQMNISKKIEIWDEHFYLLLFPLLPLLLWWLRKGSLFGLAIMFFFAPELHGEPFSHYFMNAEQHGKQVLEAQDYESASQIFNDPYRRGVACYRAGNYAEAEKMFRSSLREEVASSAAYNLGNALAYQQKFKEAIAAYEGLLEKWPNHIQAKENLEVIKKLLDQNKENESENDQQKDDEQKDDQHKENQENKDRNQSENQQKSDDNKDKSPENQAENEKSSESTPEDKNDKSDQNEEDREKKDQNQEQEQQLNDKTEEEETSKNEALEGKNEKSQEDLDADLWLNRLENDQKKFLRNKFYIESKKNGTSEGLSPW